MPDNKPFSWTCPECGRQVPSRVAGGRQPELALSATAPLSLSPATGFSSGTSTDTARIEGTRRYEQVVEGAAREAEKADDYWTRIKSSCAVRVSSGSAAASDER